ncbi:tetratricopeptide repeat protein [candidate division WOR-3 bacterium]|nr:tetratricopeptide repeat protein [candidate division WOR-3 bacterium]
MKNLIPYLVKKKFSEGKTHGDLDCYVLLADLTGFSGVTDRCLKMGKKGCEKIKDLLSLAFDSSINAVYDSGGFIEAFAGDGFTALFDKNSCEIENIFKAASEISNTLVEDGLDSMTFKIGLSAGICSWKIIETHYQITYFFEGEGIERAAYFKSRASPREVIVDFRLIKEVKNKDLIVKKGENFLLSQKARFDPKENLYTPLSGAPFDETPWINPALVSEGGTAEFRDVVSLFICFERSNDSLYGLRKIAELSYENGGYLNKIDFGDKGGIALVLFGAPCEIEKKYTRAADYALSLRRIHKFENKIGISCGKVFCGFIGNEKRSEYTVLGTAANVSSRLAEKASNREILMDESFSKKISDNFKTYPVGEENLRGMKGNTKILGLSSKKRGEDAKKTEKAPFTGRKNEISALKSIANAVFTSKKSHFVVLSGQTGIGKSRLIEEFNLSFSGCDFKIIEIVCDDVLRKPFSALKGYLKTVFEFSENDNEFLNRVRFEDILFRKINKALESDDKETSEKISLSSECFSFFLGFDLENSEFQILDAKTKYRICSRALKDLLLFECSEKPTILEIFNSDNMDEDSLAVISDLTIPLKTTQTMVVFETRDLSFGDRIKLFDQTENTKINLSKLSHGESESLLRIFMDIYGRQNESVLFSDEHYNITEGNPLYLENLARTVTSEDSLSDPSSLIGFLSDPPDLSSLILSRYDRFPKSIKEAVRVASVLGVSFTDGLFESVFKELFPEFKSRDCLQNALSNDVFKKTTEGYSFSSALMREIVYGIQMNPFLSKAHFLAAEYLQRKKSVDKLSLEEIAKHYIAAEKFREGATVLLEAAKSLYGLYLNHRALACLDNAQEICTKDNTSLENFEIQYYKASIYRLTGKWVGAKSCAQKCLWTAHRHKMPKEYCLGLDILASLERNSGNTLKALNIAKRGLKIAESIKDDFMTSIMETSLGHTLFRRGDYQEALARYSNSLSLSKDDKLLKSKILNNIANIWAEIGNFEKSLEFYTESLKLCRENRDIATESVALLNIGTIFHSLDEYEKAMDSYSKGLALKNIYGDEDGILILKSNMGSVQEAIGDFKKALELFKESAEKAREIGDGRSLSIALVNMAGVHKDLNEIEEAEKLYTEAIEISKKTGSIYNLSNSFYQLADLNFEKKDYNKSETYLERARGLALKVGRKNVLENCEILGHALDYVKGKSPDRAISELDKKHLLSKDKKVKADISYIIFQLTKNPRKAERALKEYSALSKMSKNVLYKNRKEEIQNFLASKSDEEDR